MSRKFLTPKDEYAVSRTVKAFEALTVLQTQALTISGHYYLEFVKEPCRKQNCFVVKTREHYRWLSPCPLPIGSLDLLLPL